MPFVYVSTPTAFGGAANVRAKLSAEVRPMRRGQASDDMAATRIELLTFTNSQRLQRRVNDKAAAPNAYCRNTTGLDQSPHRRIANSKKLASHLNGHCEGFRAVQLIV
jgi:hypothetical protein